MLNWDEPLIFKELTEVYFVNGKKFWTKRDAEIYIAELEMKEIGRRIGNAEQSSKTKKTRKKTAKRSNKKMEKKEK